MTLEAMSVSGQLHRIYYLLTVFHHDKIQAIIM